MQNYTEVLIARGVIKLPAYKKTKQATLEERIHAVSGSFIDERIESAIEHALTSRHALERAVEGAVGEVIEEALKELDFGSRIDDLEVEVDKLSGTKEQVDDVEESLTRLDNGVEEIAGSVKDVKHDLKYLTTAVDKLEATINKPKGRLARWLEL